MKELIEQRIAQLQKEHEALAKELQGAEQFIQQAIQTLNAKQGAITELKELQKSMAEPVAEQVDEKE